MLRAASAHHATDHEEVLTSGAEDPMPGSAVTAEAGATMTAGPGMVDNRCASERQHTAGSLLVTR